MVKSEVHNKKLQDLKEEMDEIKKIKANTPEEREEKK